MAITTNDILHIVKLAKVELDQEQVELFTAQLANVLNYMQQLNKLDTSGMPSTFHALDDTGWLRPDQVEPGLDIDQVMENAPAHDGRNFIVPKIL